jgi:hypothetical protein
LKAILATLTYIKDQGRALCLLASAGHLHLCFERLSLSSSFWHIIHRPYVNMTPSVRRRHSASGAIMLIYLLLGAPKARDALYRSESAPRIDALLLLRVPRSLVLYAVPAAMRMEMEDDGWTPWTRRPMP